MEEQKPQPKGEAPLQSSEMQTKAENYYQQGVSAHNRGDCEEATLNMRTALSLDPSNPKFHYNIAYLYTVANLPEIAVNHYKLFLKYAPKDDPEIPLIKGRVKYLEELIKKKTSR